MPTSASFAGRDDATQGSFFDPAGPTFVYCQDGFQVTSAASFTGMNMPSYVSGFTVLDSPNEAQFVARTSERYGLLRYPGGDPDDRYFPLWYKADFRIAFTVSQACRFAVYNRDNDFGRVQTIAIQDGDTDAVLDSRTIEGFDGGAWLSWDLSPGNYTLRATSPTAAIICAVGWGPSGSSPEPVEETGVVGLELTPAAAAAAIVAPTSAIGLGLRTTSPAAAIAAPPAAAGLSLTAAAVVRVLAAPPALVGLELSPIADVGSSGSRAEVGVVGLRLSPAAVVRVLAAPTPAAGLRLSPAAVVGPDAPGPAEPDVRGVVLLRTRPASSPVVLAAASAAAGLSIRPAAKVGEVLDLRRNVDPYRCVLVVDPAAALECDPESAELVQ